MKKVVLIFIAIVSCFCIAGCTSTATTSSSSDNTNPVENKKIEYSLNQDIYIKNDAGEYKIKITGIRETSDRNQFSDTETKRVIIISYEYENISLEDDLYISSMDYKVYDKQGKVLEEYPADYKYPDSIGTGRSATAEMAYALNSDDNYVEIEFYDNMFNSKSDCLIKVEW